ncbi:hypothetical protein B0H13DRAFT_2301914 [Mycena leptocephala]|nr:hypothetical protein B0H13DRAFT_2301914 [Mycena leptocephala]
MANHIPDEIISEILSPALRVSDAAFSTLSQAGSGPSPFMTFSESSSAFLVVSKAWLRVATPLLYNVVVIRSKAQAQALAATLNANPALGRFIKKLRVEGGFAISMLKILQNSPNITDLFLSLEIPRPDNACGLLRGLHLINPIITIRTETHYYLEKCIPIWEKLVPDIVIFLRSLRHTAIPKALSKAPNLGMLVVWDFEHYVQRVPAYVRTIASNSSLKRLRLEPQRRDYHQEEFYNEVKQDSRLKVLFDLSDESPKATDDVSLPTPFVYPARLAADPAAEDAIWSRVLYFVLYRTASKARTFPPYRDPNLHRLAPLLVCKTFARLSIPHLCVNPVLHSMSALVSFASQLVHQPLLGHRVRCLSIIYSGDLGLFKSILMHTSALTELHGIQSRLPLTWTAFSELGALTGSSLRSFYGIPVSKATSAVDPAVFARFSQMREFSWDSGTVFKTGPKLVSADTFGLLVALTVDTYEASFLDVLSDMELPSLRTVVFSATASGDARFFQRHGAKLRELTLSVLQITDAKLAIWHNCPSLTVLGVACDYKHPASSSCLETSGVHEHLERIVFRTTPFYRLKQSHQTALGNLLLSVQLSASFPALREIEHPLCDWSTAEPQISKSRWVKWAEGLLERDVHLVGPEGTAPILAPRPAPRALKFRSVSARRGALSLPRPEFPGGPSGSVEIAEFAGWEGGEVDGRRFLRVIESTRKCGIDLALSSTTGKPEEDPESAEDHN